MKKLFCIIILVFSGIIVSSAQNVVIQQNSNGSNTSDKPDNQYYINGISTREDIGGVEVCEEIKQRYGDAADSYLKFTNYNDFTVSVIYEVTGYKTSTGTIILKAGETKRTTDLYYRNTKNFSYKLIARRMGGGVAGAAAPQASVATASQNELVILHGYLAVYPEDLGLYKIDDYPYSVIRNINSKGAYGRHNWRLPTQEEMAMMKQKENELKMKNGKYMCCDSNGKLISYTPYGYEYPQSIRLVSSN